MLKQLCLFFLLINFGLISSHGGHKTLGPKAGRNAGTLYRPHSNGHADRAGQNAQKRKFKAYEKIKLSQSKPSNCSDFCYAACAIVAVTTWAAFGTWLAINNEMKA